MKKLLVSAGVIVSFVAYSWHQRSDTSSLKPGSSAALSGSESTSSTKNNIPTGSNTINSVTYQDGSYTGSVEDAFYGNIQVRAVIKNARIADVQFLQYPNDRENSIAINTQAMPYLKQEAIQTQNANVNIISGATDTSQAFVRSLQDALDQAKKG